MTWRPLLWTLSLGLSLSLSLGCGPAGVAKYHAVSVPTPPNANFRTSIAIDEEGNLYALSPQTAEEPTLHRYRADARQWHAVDIKGHGDKVGAFFTGADNKLYVNLTDGVYRLPPSVEKLGERIFPGQVTEPSGTSSAPPGVNPIVLDLKGRLYGAVSGLVYRTQPGAQAYDPTPVATGKVGPAVSPDGTVFLTG